MTRIGGNISYIVAIRHRLRPTSMLRQGGTFGRSQRQLDRARGVGRQGGLGHWVDKLQRLHKRHGLLGPRLELRAVGIGSEVGVVVVIHLHAAALYGAVHEHRAAAAEPINAPAVVIRRHLVDDPQQLALAAHPWDKAVQGASPPSSGRES